MREEHTVARVNIKDHISWLLSQYTYNAIPTIYNAILNTMQYHSHRMQCNNTRERSPIDNFDGGCNNFDGGCNNIKKDYVYCVYCDYMIWRDPWKVANRQSRHERDGRWGRGGRLFYGQLYKLRWCCCSVCILYTGCNGVQCNNVHTSTHVMLHPYTMQQQHIAHTNTTKRIWL